LGVALRCAGETSKFELRSHLDYDGSKVTGSWEERTFNASGDASGVMKPGSLRLHFHGGVSGDMTVAFTTSRQSISITVDAGGAVSGVHLQMSRR
jgi:beta-xylosidase